MGLLVHVFETQALTKPIERAYTAEVQCLLKCTALDEDGGPLECQRSCFGYCAFYYFHFDVRSDLVSIVVGLGVSTYRRRVPTVCRDCAGNGPTERLGSPCAFLTQEPLIYSFVCGRTWLRFRVVTDSTPFKSDTF